MKAQNANRTAAAAAMALLAMSVSGPAQAAGDSTSDLEWAMASKVSDSATSALRSTYSRPTLVLVENACQWKSAMETLSSSHSLAYGADQEPNVDWTRQAVVVVALGQVPYGYSLKVNEVRQAQGKLMVDVHVDYQSYENSLEDVSPAAMVVVDARAPKVRVLYNLDLPGLPHQGGVPNCGSSSGSQLASSDGDSGSTQTATWGAMKSLYR